MYGYIYKTTNLVNNKIYIGQKKSDKFLEEAYLGSGVRLHSAIQHYGPQSFKVDLIEKCTTKEELDEREKFWIKKYNSRDLSIGYNIAPGGQSSCWNKGKHLSEEHKRKISESERGKCYSKESIEKMKIAKRNISDETRYKMSLAKKGSNHPNFGKSLSDATREKIKKSKENISDETRQKLRESRLGTSMSRETREKISKHSKSGTPEVRAKISLSRKGMSAPNKGKILVTDGCTKKYIFKEELNDYIPLGYKPYKKQI